MRGQYKKGISQANLFHDRCKIPKQSIRKFNPAIHNRRIHHNQAEFNPRI